jgi:hypothetical protein
LVLDKEGLINTSAPFLGSGKTFVDLHQWMLIFQEDNLFRSRARYLYYQYVMVMVKIAKFKKTPKADVINHMPEFTSSALGKILKTQIWYLKKIQIRAIIEGIEHDEKEEDAKKMLSHARRELLSKMTRMVQTKTALNVESEDEYYF